MEKKRNIVQYRERLEKTLASPDLTNDQMLKTLVESQVLRSSGQEIEGYKEKLIETKTAEVSNILDMLRSASVNDKGAEGSSISHSDWKLKQDNEEFRVMYREAPEGTPFHTLLVEGYVDGPVDACLCLSWETSLYKTWWPQSTIPTFKIIAAECLQKVRIGEQLALVRMKVPWPLSTREVIVHYYVFEYFQDDLIVVILNSVSESKRVDETITGFDNAAIPEAKDVVRMDLVGGFVVQKVTSERSYFRTIANMDIKVDFIPPSLINFISRQLIGSGFRLYQKAVASKKSHDKELIKAMGDPLYVRIRKTLYSINGSKAIDGEDLTQVANILPAEDLIQSKQDAPKYISWEDRSNRHENILNGEIVEDNIETVEEDIVEIVQEDYGEIVQIEKDDKKVDEDIPNEQVDIDIRSIVKGNRNVNISSEVKLALGTLDRAISMVRKNRFHRRRSSSSCANEESRDTEKSGLVDSYSSKLVEECSKTEFSFQVSNSNILEEISQEPRTNSFIQNFSHTGTNPNSKEVNYNKIVPASSEKNLSRPIETTQVASYSLNNGTKMDQTRCDNQLLNTDTIHDMGSDDPINSTKQKKSNNLVNQGNSLDVTKQPRMQRKYRYCCF
ncbi:putative START-like domain-containing protein [Lupinus albus]|uniref:Putative START-like domain-containing protein n=1 Tax=Lupinus albus TaxID=3870 RepID=A0A6A4R7V2_LUPAL|nr:putative START-like domain-containing protein [Lupinus albus]